MATPWLDFLRRTLAPAPGLNPNDPGPATMGDAQDTIMTQQYGPPPTTMARALAQPPPPPVIQNGPPLPPAAMMALSNAIPNYPTNALNGLPPQAIVGLMQGVDQLRKMAEAKQQREQAMKQAATTVLMNQLAARQTVPLTQQGPPMPERPIQLPGTGVNPQEAPPYLMTGSHAPDTNALGAAVYIPDPADALARAKADQAAHPTDSIQQKVLDAAVNALSFGNKALNAPLEYDKDRQGDVYYRFFAWETADDVEEAKALGLIPKKADGKLAAELFRRGKEWHNTVQMSPFVENIVDTSPLLAGGSERELIREGVLDAYRKGYASSATNYPLLGQEVRVNTGFVEPGSRAVWEYLAGRRGTVRRATTDILSDPTTAIGIERPLTKGLVEAGAEMAARASARAAEKSTLERVLATVPGRAVEGTGRALQAPDVLLNKIPDAVIDPTKTLLADAFRSIPGVGRVFNHLAEFTAPTKAEMARDAVVNADAMDEATSAMPTRSAPTDIGGVPAPQPGETIKQLPPGAPYGVSGTDLVIPAAGPRPADHPLPGLSGISAGESQAYTPGADVGLQDFVEPNAPPMTPEDMARIAPLFPEGGGPRQVQSGSPQLPGDDMSGQIYRKKGQYFVLGRDEEIRINETSSSDPSKRWKVTVKDETGTHRQRSAEFFPTRAEAERYGREQLRGGGAQPTTKPPKPSTSQAATQAPLSEPVPPSQWSTTPNPRSSGIKETLPSDQWTRILDHEITTRDGTVTFRDWTSQKYEPFMSNPRTSKADRAIAEQRYRFYVEQSAKELGIDIPDWKTNADNVREPWHDRARVTRIIEEPNWDAPTSIVDRARLYARKIISKNPTDAEAFRRYRNMIDAHAQAHGANPDDVVYMHSGPGGRPGDTENDRLPRGSVGNLFTSPNPETPHLDVLDRPMTGAANVDVEGMTPRQLIASLSKEAADDQELYQRLAGQGYLPERYRGKEAPKISLKTERIKVKTGEVDKVVGGKTKKVPVYEWRTAQVPNGDPNEVMAALQRKWTHSGDIATESPRVLARERAGWEVLRDTNSKGLRQFPLALDFLHALFIRLPKHLLLADPITSWGYTMRNMLGNLTTSSIGRDGVREWSIRDMIAAGRDPNASVAGDLLDDLGLGIRSVPREFTQLSDKMDPSAASVSTPTRRLFQKLHVDFPARIFDWKRGLDHRIERGMKVGGTFSPFLRGFVGEELSLMAKEIESYAARRGIPVTSDEIMTSLMLARTERGMIDQHRVYDAMYRLAKGSGVDDVSARKMAETTSRQWPGRAKSAYDRAVAETNRRMPVNRMRNIDRYASWLTIFHFWPTRTAMFLMEEMLKDPRIIMWWQRSHQGLQRMAEEGDYPASVKGLMWLANSPFGFALYANPASLYLLTSLQPDRADYADPNGMTGLGKFLSDLRQKTGLGPMPFIDALMNVSGVYGDTFPANVWPSRTAELAGSALDAMLVHAGHDPGTPVYDQAMVNLRETITNHIPWSDGIPARSVDGYRTDLVASMVLSQNPELLQGMMSTNPETAMTARKAYDAILQNEDDPRYISAEKSVYDQLLATKVVNVFSPLTVSAKIDQRERLIDLNKTGKDIPWDQKTPEQQAASTIRGDVTSTNQDRTLGIQSEEYATMGTDRQRWLGEEWNRIVNGGGKDWGAGHFLVIADNIIIEGRDLMGMTKEQRMDLADRWVSYKNGSEELAQYRDERKAYVAAHPAIGEYKDYQSTAYDAINAGGGEKFRTDMARSNENFRRALDEKTRSLKGMPSDQQRKELDKWTTSLAAYEAAAGIRSSVYDPEPAKIPSAPPWMVGIGATSGNGAQTSSGPKSEVAKLEQDIAEYQLASQLFIAQHGAAPEMFDPMAKKAFENQGLLPKMSKRLELYLAWASFQPKGADTSPAAYIAYLDSLKRKGQSIAA